MALKGALKPQTRPFLDVGGARGGGCVISWPQSVTSGALEPSRLLVDGSEGFPSVRVATPTARWI